MCKSFLLYIREEISRECLKELITRSNSVIDSVASFGDLVTTDKKIKKKNCFENDIEWPRVTRMRNRYTTLTRIPRALKGVWGC